jgi:hypothetical protein
MLRYISPDDLKGLFHNFFMMLLVLEQNNLNVIINWYYERDDKDIMESTKIISEVLRITINLYPVEAGIINIAKNPA